MGAPGRAGRQPDHDDDDRRRRQLRLLGDAGRQHGLRGHATGPPTKQLTARLFQGVRDVVALSASAATASIGESLTLTGTVSPEKVGHVIDLEQLGSDGSYHLLKVGFIDAASTFQFSWTPATVGTKSLRAEIEGGPENLGGVSPAVTVAVNTLPPVSSLPAAS